SSTVGWVGYVWFQPLPPFSFSPPWSLLMMGSSHAATGLAVGGVVLAGLSWAGAPIGFADVVFGGMVCAGAALLPDLDHPTSTATLSQGPVSAAASRGVRALSSRVWRATRTPWDRGGRDGDGVHRHLSHTVPAAAVCGAVVAVAGLWWPALALVVWVVFSLAVRGLAACWRGRRLGGAEASGAALLVTIGVFGLGVGWLVATGVVGVVVVVRVIGVALTVAGVPRAWPVRVRGARGRMVGAPLRFRTGRERLVVEVIRWGALGATTVWVLVGLL